MKAAILSLMSISIIGWITATTLSFQKADCTEQLRLCTEHNRQLDSTLKAQTEYYLNFHGVHKAMLPGDTVLLIVH